MPGIGKFLIVTGLLLAAVGVLVVFADKLPFKIGRLPGDIVYKSKNTTVYFPLATSILLSIILSLIMWAINRRR